MTTRTLLLMVTALASCRPSDGRCVDTASSPVVAERGVDSDQDGLDDDTELALAREHLPFIAHHPEDHCPLAGLVFRARPHPDDAALVVITYSQLYARDCGLNGHIGDNEAFGAVVDPSLAPPAGLVALVAISHQGTPCERTTTCGTCPGMNACDRVEGRAVLYCSRDKHGGAVDLGGGCSFGSCLEACAVPVVAPVLALVNAGEPDHPLVHDLTDEGFIKDGWDPALQHFDPWSRQDFGGAGNIAGDLTDPAFVLPACTCLR